MDSKAEYLSEYISDPFEYLHQLRQTTEPIGGSTEYTEDGELVEYDVAIVAIKKAINKTATWYKSALVAEMERRKEECDTFYNIALSNNAKLARVAIEEQKRQYNSLLSFIDTIEVKDPYEQCIQHDSIKAGIQAHAETYSFNIESELFNQLTKEQQALWRKEIEQACISGGEVGVELTRDLRYKENVEDKEIGLEDSVKETLAQKYIDYTFKRHNIDPESKEGHLIYYAYMHGMNQCLNQLNK